MPAARFSLTGGLLPPGKTDWQLSSILLASGREQPPDNIIIIRPTCYIDFSGLVLLNQSCFMPCYWSEWKGHHNGCNFVLIVNMERPMKFVRQQRVCRHTDRIGWKHESCMKIRRDRSCDAFKPEFVCLPSFWFHELLHGTYNHFRCVLWTASIEFDALIEKNWKFKWTSSSSRCSTVSGLCSSLVYGQDHADMLSASGHGLARPGLTVWWPRWSLRHYSWLLRPHTWSIPRRNGPP